MDEAVAERGTRPLLTFRLDPALWRDVRARLAHDGRTLSDVVNQGLTDYVDHAVDLHLPGATKEPRQPRRTDTRPGGTTGGLALSEETSSLLQELRASGDGKLLSATLAHLHELGWPFRTLADALGISRQAVQSRVRRVPAEVRVTVGNLQPPPLYPRQRQPMAPGVRRRPSTVQVDVELRHRARAKAWREGVSLTQVVERILRSYLGQREAGKAEDVSRQ
ncbi:MAG: hypothetical protein JWO62_1913 [Acidimicrobiaceae bacterium]|nr:hypothetical protein [Acidimicrobiaceae bacterium]